MLATINFRVFYLKESYVKKLKITIYKSIILFPVYMGMVTGLQQSKEQRLRAFENKEFRRLSAAQTVTKLHKVFHNLYTFLF